SLTTFCCACNRLQFTSAGRAARKRGGMNMLRSLATGVILLALGAVVAAPVPGETRKPAAFPAGHYVLAGGGEPARGDDVYEFTKTFRLKPNQYVLSGGPKPTDPVFVDDDLEVYQEKTA